MAILKIEVKRYRNSLTQGSATVYINDKEIITFGDAIYLKCKDGTFTNGFNTVTDGQHYGEVISGYGSIKPDSDFIIALLYNPNDNICKYSERVRAAIKEL